MFPWKPITASQAPLFRPQHFPREVERRLEAEWSQDEQNESRRSWDPEGPWGTASAGQQWPLTPQREGSEVQGKTFLDSVAAWNVGVEGHQLRLTVDCWPPSCSHMKPESTWRRQPDWLLFSVCILSWVFWMFSRLCSLRDLSSWNRKQELHSPGSSRLLPGEQAAPAELTWVCLMSWCSSVSSSAIFVSADMLLLLGQTERRPAAAPPWPPDRKTLVVLWQKQAADDFFWTTRLSAACCSAGRIFSLRLLHENLNFSCFSFRLNALTSA